MLLQDNNGHYRSGPWGTGKDYGTNKDTAAMGYFADKFVKKGNSNTVGILGLIIIGSVICTFISNILEKYPWIYAIIGVLIILIIVVNSRKFAKEKLYDKVNPLIDEGRWTESKEYLEKLANKYKDKDACRLLGDMYYNGNGVDKNIDSAKEWFKKACDYGDVGYSEYMQGFILSPKIENTSDEAMEFIKQSSVNESVDGIIECVWRYTCRNNEKDKKDYKRAVKALSSLVKETSIPYAQWVLADAYVNGVVIEKNLDKAVEYYKMAAEQNHWPAMASLERCYENGIGVSQNTEEAKKWHDLAVKYATGEGIDLYSTDE